MSPAPPRPAPGTNELIDGDLGLTLTTTTGTTTAQLALATPRGNTATTITLPTGATGPTGTAATGINTWTDYTEYGQPRQPATTTPGGVTGIGYGWLGAKQRATLDTGLTLMGARLYNQVTGTFTSLDPVHDGGDTPFGYPNDPIQMQDLDGNFWSILGRLAWQGCRMYCKRAGSYAAKRWVKPAARWTYRKAIRPAARWGAKKVVSGWRKFAHYANHNPHFRVGPYGGRFRVSFGQTHKHWGKMPPRQQSLRPIHGHFDRSYGVIHNWRRYDQVKRLWKIKFWGRN